MTLLVASLSAVAAALVAGVVLRVPVVPALRRPSLDLRRFVPALAGVGAGAVVAAVSGSVALGVFPGLVVALAPSALRARRQAEAADEVHRAWPDALRDLIASVASGASLASALERLAQRGPHALRPAFDRYVTVSKTAGVVPALETVKRDLADPTSDRVLEVLMLAHERGGGMVTEILQDLAEATTRDLWALEQVRTENLEQKINARAVFVLPWIVLIALTAREGAIRDFYAAPAGVLVIAIGALASGFGMWLVGRLGREPDEPRVFGP